MLWKTKKTAKYAGDLERAIKGQRDYSSEERELASLKQNYSSADRKARFYRFLTNSYTPGMIISGIGAWITEMVAAYQIAYRSTGKAEEAATAVVITAILGGLATALATAFIHDDSGLYQSIESIAKEKFQEAKDLSGQIGKLEQKLQKMPDLAYLVRADAVDTGLVAQIKGSVNEGDEVKFIYSGMDPRQVEIVQELTKTLKGVKTYEQDGIYTADDTAKTLEKLAQNRKKQVGIVLMDATVAMSMSMPDEEYAMKLSYSPEKDKWQREELVLAMPSSVYTPSDESAIRARIAAAVAPAEPAKAVVAEKTTRAARTRVTA